MEIETYNNLMQNEALNEHHPSAFNLQNGAIRLEPGCSQLIDAHQIQILENPQQLQGTTAAPPEILAKTANEPSLSGEKVRTTTQHGF